MTHHQPSSKKLSVRSHLYRYVSALTADGQYVSGQVNPFIQIRRLGPVEPNAEFPDLFFLGGTGKARERNDVNMGKFRLIPDSF